MKVSMKIMHVRKQVRPYVEVFGSHLVVLILSMMGSSVKLKSPMMMIEALLGSCLGLLAYCVSIALLAVAGCNILLI